MSPSRFLAAAIQMTSTADVERNLASAERLVREAASRGARLVGLPENFAFLRSEGEPVPEAQSLEGPWVSRMAALAREHHLTLLLGSVPEAIEDAPRVYNTSVLLGPDGSLLAHYRKMHLFDIDIPGMESLKESRSVAPGAEIVVAEAPCGPLGLSICYDLRFPELYRALALAGAEILTVPANFTERTGRDHWEVLLRARAIENGAYVLAPSQIGGPPGHPAYGRSMIIDPWGTIVAQAPDAETWIAADIETDRVAAVRRQIPVLANRRPAAYRLG
jgi:predicted amidohydrolase